MEEKLLKHLKEIRDIKHKLLPDFSSDYGNFRYETWYKPDISGGGDYFDVLVLPDVENYYGLIIADVSGHGAGAAVETVMLDTILRTYPVDLDKGPAGALNYANNYLFSKKLRGNFITAFIMDYDWGKSLISYVNAGHPPPFIVYDSGNVELLDSGNHIPLCIEKDYCWTNQTFSAKNLDKIILYTDGIIELKKLDGQQLGIDGLGQIIEKSSDLNSIKNHIAEYVSEEELADSDDITIIVASINPG